MAFTADFEKYKFPESAFEGRRVLITGSGKDGGIGQALALTAAANGAKVIGVHFNSNHYGGFDLVDVLAERGIEAFAMQANVTNTRDFWASRSYVVEQTGAGYRHL